jgi:hypothetical protein
VFFLQHVTSQLLKLLRKHAEGVAHMQPVAAPLVDGGRSGSGAGSPLHIVADAASSNDGSSVTYAVSAVADAFLALDVIRGHFLSSLCLDNTHTSHGGTLHDNCQVLSSVTSDCARVGVHTPLAACLQECVRLGAVVEQLQPLREVIRTYCEPMGAASPTSPSLLLGGLTTPPGSPQQQQLFGLMCSLLKTLQPKAKAPPGAQSNSQLDVQTCRKGVMAVLEVAATAINLQLQHTAVPRAAVVGRSTQGQPAGDPVATSAAAAAAARQAISTCFLLPASRSRPSMDIRRSYLSI